MTHPHGEHAIRQKPSASSLSAPPPARPSASEGSRWPARPPPTPYSVRRLSGSRLPTRDREGRRGGGVHHQPIQPDWNRAPGRWSWPPLEAALFSLVVIHLTQVESLQAMRPRAVATSFSDGHPEPCNNLFGNDLRLRNLSELDTQFFALLMTASFR